MKTEATIWYEPHPVTPERKKELIGAGYRILDAKFAPPGWKAPNDAEDHPKRLTGVDVGPADMTANELRAELDAAGVEYVKHAPKAKLVELVDALRESLLRS